MPSYAHKKLVEEILRIDQLPSETDAFLQWIEAAQHLQFLISNAGSDEIVVFGSGPYTFVHSIVVPNDVLFPLDKSDLLRWSGNPYTSIASYVYGGGRDDMWIEHRSSIHGSKTLEKGKNLVFGRTFEGWSGKGRNYFEVHQEYAHLAEIHWRPEHNAYCRYDDNGDLDYIVSITTREDGNVTLASFTWPKLEEYLAVSNSSLVRMFDFTLLRREGFSGWPPGPENFSEPLPTLFYRQKVVGDAAYTRGVQIISLQRPAKEVFVDIKCGWSGRKKKQYVDFIAYDWRNKRIARISTDPKATTTYFDVKNNALPFELSPAFFRPEVLSKYKTDRSKYKITTRGVECRAAWSLRGYDVNKAGQVHAYICDLRDLPHSEQLHWASYNEEPKETISERAYVNDFKGEFISFQHPRDEMLSIAKRWDEDQVYWWTLRDDDLLDRANLPLTSSKEEWADAFMDISQLIVEGFEVKSLRKMLDRSGIAYDQKDQSVLLLEKLIAHTKGSTSPLSLTGLRAAQQIRSKVKGHAGSSEGKKIAEDALAQHGSFAEHFRHVCQLIVAELETIERTCALHVPPAPDTDQHA